MTIDHCLKYLKSLSDVHIQEILYSFYKAIPETIPELYNLETYISNHYNSYISLYGMYVDAEDGETNHLKLVTIGYEPSHLNTYSYFLRVKTKFVDISHHSKQVDINNLVSIIRKYKISNV